MSSMDRCWNDEGGRLFLVGASLLRTALPTEEDGSFPSEGPVPSVSHRSTSREQ